MKAVSTRTEQPKANSSSGKHEATVQASTLSQSSVTGPEAPLAKTISKVPALFTRSVNSKAPPFPKLPSSGMTEVLGQEQQSHSNSGVHQPKAPAISFGSMKPKAPPKPKPPSSAVTEVSEGPGEFVTSGRGAQKSKAPTKAQRAKQHSKPGPKQMLLPFVASGLSSNHGAETGRPPSSRPKEA